MKFLWSKNMLKSFKDYMKDEDYMMNEGKFEDTPYTGKLLLALKKSFEKYYKTAKGKINFLAANPSYIFDTLNPTSYLSGGSDELIDFISVCSKYEGMANFIKKAIREHELQGKFKSIEDAYNELEYVHGNQRALDVVINGADAVKKQTKVIFNEIKKELNI